MAPRSIVMGAGGVGGVLGAALSEAGHEVVAVTTNRTIADAIERDGLRLRGRGGRRVARVRVALGVPPGERFDFALLATQPPSVEDAARMAMPALRESGALVCLQNGLCEERVARIAGAERTFGAVVAWGAAMPEPGVYERTARGGLTLGRLDGRPDPRLDVLRDLLGTAFPTTITTNLLGARWSKLAMNCAISSLGTLGGDRLGALVRHAFVRRLALEVMTEAIEVARAAGVRLEKVSGTIDLARVALTPAEPRATRSASLAAKHALLLAVGLRYRRMRSSMLSAIERGRTPAVDFLNGEVVERGRALGVPTPVNARVRDEVWRLARKDSRPSLATLREVFDATREHA